MQLKTGIFLFIFWIGFYGFGQLDGLNENARISVITCGPGKELYASFGHSAFRVQDPKQGIDWVYNYGTFNFEAPNFYYNFAVGRPIFTLSVSTFPEFLYSYQLENRWVKEQLLDLNPQLKNELFLFLENNRRPENRNYKYDYLYDNCSTKIPEILKNVLGTQLNYRQDHLVKRFTFRELIQQNLKINSWSSFGIDLALGAVIDKKASAEEHMFLPFYVMDQMKNTTLDGKPLVERQRTILEATLERNGYYFTASPLFWFLIFLSFTAVITFIDIRNGSRARWLDFFLFFVSGAVGSLIFFLWFLTDHSATANNFNIFWAFPLNMVVAFFLLRRYLLPRWFLKYIMVPMGFLVLALIIWLVKIQLFSPLTAIPILALGIRYLFLCRYYKKTYLKTL